MYGCTASISLGIFPFLLNASYFSLSNKLTPKVTSALTISFYAPSKSTKYYRRMFFSVDSGAKKLLFSARIPIWTLEEASICTLDT
jgi:hypothetical protein